MERSENVGRQLALDCVVAARAVPRRSRARLVGARQLQRAARGAEADGVARLRVAEAQPGGAGVALQRRRRALLRLQHRLPHPQQRLALIGGALHEEEREHVLRDLQPQVARAGRVEPARAHAPERSRVRALCCFPLGLLLLRQRQRHQALGHARVRGAAPEKRRHGAAIEERHTLCVCALSCSQAPLLLSLLQRRVKPVVQRV
jgi:hypothetical protein